jgi:hypothetical protein
MRYIVLLALAAVVAGCSEAESSRIDYRTYAISGPGVPGGAEGPNRREAMRRCPKGYRVLDSSERRNTSDGYNSEDGVFTNWTIRCL